MARLWSEVFYLDIEKLHANISMSLFSLLLVFGFRRNLCN